MPVLELSERQNCVLQVPLDVQGFAHFGGKGSGKTTDACLLALQWCEIYDNARCLCLRRHFPDLEGIKTEFFRILGILYGPSSARKMWNGSDYRFLLPNGALIQLGAVTNIEDAGRYAGRNFNFLFVDEYPMFESPAIIAAVRKELRGTMRPRVVLTGNPGYILHDYVERKFLSHAPWQRWQEEETGLTWITIPSNAHDNPFLDADEHIRQIATVAEDDPDLARALQTGDFSAIKTGEFFGNAWNYRSSVVAPWPALPEWGWHFFVAIDHGGGSSVTACLFCALAVEGAHGPYGDFYPAGSLVVFDEVHDAVEGDWNKTRGKSIADNCYEIVKTANGYEMYARGLIDPQVEQDHGDDSKLIDTYRANGVSVEGWPKHRRANGAAVVRELMHGAAPQHSRRKPGLYIAQHCAGTLGTVPRMPRDRRNRDVPVDANDHFYDALVGACMYRRKSFSIKELVA